MYRRQYEELDIIDVLDRYDKTYDTHFPDRIPITKIHVTNFPFTTIGNILRPFRKFGTIKEYFISKTNAFITYNTVEDALKARIATVKIGKRELVVSPADPWHQDRILSNRNRNPRNEDDMQNNETDSSQDSNILTVLNEDCFMKIFSYLSLYDLIKIERVSKQWRYLVQQKYKCITDFSPLYMEIWMVYIIFKKIGPYLKTLNLNGSISQQHRLLHIVSKFCPNIIKLDVYELDFTHGDILLKKCRNLKSLHLGGCRLIRNQEFLNCKVELEEFTISDSLFTFDYFMYVCNTKSLLKLCIRNTCISEIFLIETLPRLENLRELILEEISITDTTVIKILTTLKNLKNLQILSPIRTTEVAFESILGLQNLETLKLKLHLCISEKLLIKIAKNCLKLSNIEISIVTSFDVIRSEEIMDTVLSQILCLKNLQYLNINGLNVTDIPFKKCLGRNENGVKLNKISCRQNEFITEEMVYAVFRSCPELKYIDLYGSPMVRYDNLLRDLPEIVHAHGCSPDRHHLNLTYSVVSPCSCLKFSYDNDTTSSSGYHMDGNLFLGFDDCDDDLSSYSDFDD